MKKWLRWIGVALGIVAAGLLMPAAEWLGWREHDRREAEACAGRFHFARSVIDSAAIVRENPACARYVPRTPSQTEEER